MKREGPGFRVRAIQVALLSLFVCGFLLFASTSFAQSSGDPEENKAEVKPPLTPAPVTPDKAERTPLKVSAKDDVRRDTPGLTIKPGKVLHTDVDVALVNVTVTDPYNRLVTGLEPDNFRVFEDNSEQEVVSFSSEDVPISIGVIFDLSGSMSNKIAKAREAASCPPPAADPCLATSAWLSLCVRRVRAADRFWRGCSDGRSQRSFSMPAGAGAHRVRRSRG